MAHRHSRLNTRARAHRGWIHEAFDSRQNRVNLPAASSPLPTCIATQYLRRPRSTSADVRRPMGLPIALLRRSLIQAAILASSGSQRLWGGQMSGTRFCLCGIVIALVLNGCAGRASRLPVDSAELRTQPQIFVVHQEARTGFLIENTGYRLMGPTILGGILQGNQSASVQFNLKLEDPVIHGKERLARTLRENLDLKNMTIVPKAYQKEDGQLAEIYQGGVVLHLQTVRW